jgi:hypothetical protein
MKTGILACILGAFAVVAPPAAYGSTQYVMNADSGVCAFWVVDDASPGGVFGGPAVWDGVVYVKTGTPGVTCELKVNGVSQGTVLVGLPAGLLQFTAALTNVVSICHHVGPVSGCGDGTARPL